MAENQLVVTVRVNDRASKAFKRFGATVARTSRKMVDGFKRAARAVFSLRAAIVGFLTGAAIRSVVNAFKTQEQAVAQFDDALKRTGRFTPEFSKKMRNLASEIQRVGTAGDEAVLGASRLLLMNQKLGNELLPRATQAAVDFAAALNVSLETAFKLITNAMAGQVSMLSRYGLRLDETVAKSGDLSAILGAIEKSVKGADAALRKTTTGTLAAMSNAFGDLQESIGKAVGAILKSGLGDFLRTTFEVMQESVEGVSTAFGEADGDAKRFSDAMIAGLKGIALAAAAAGDGLEVLLLPIGALKQAGRTVEQLGIQQQIERIEKALEGANDATAEYQFTLRDGIPLLNKNAEAIRKSALGAKFTREEFARLRDQFSKVLRDEAAEEAVLKRLAEQRRNQGTQLERMTALFGEVERRMAAAAAAGRDFGKVGAGPAFVGDLSNDLGDLDITSGKAAAALDRLAKSMRVVMQPPPEQLAAIKKWNREVDEDRKRFAVKERERQRELVGNIIGFWRSGQDQLFAMTQAFTGAVIDLTTRVIDKAFEGQIQSMKDVAAIAQDVLKTLLKQMIRQLIEIAIQAAVTRAVVGFAQGGVAPGGVGNLQPVKAFASGGVVTRPTVGLIGEGKHNEAIVPLPDGSRIPVDLRGGRGEPQGDTQVNLTISAIDSQDVARVMTSPGGRTAIKRSIADAMDRSQEFRSKMRGGL